MKTKHTPGPWHHVGDGLVYAEPSFDDIEAPLVCDATEEGWMGPNDEERANAQLISAAPELLAALQALSDYFGADTDNGLDELLTQARAAISRATTEE
jgi:hypothetical protein